MQGPQHPASALATAGSDSVLSLGAESIASPCSRDLLGCPGSCTGHGTQENDSCSLTDEEQPPRDCPSSK